MKAICLLIFSGLMLLSCDQNKLKETSDSQFIGRWKLEGRSMYEGIEIEISKSDEGELQGTIVKLNENKYVQLFMAEGDKFVSGVVRSSNFEFTLTEKKIAAPLFSAYGQSTSVSYDASFQGVNKILLGKNGTDGSYVRIKK